TDVVNCEDIRMIQRSCGAGLLLEALQPLLVFGEYRWQDFDRHVATEPSVAGAIDFTHPARAKGRDDFVRPEGCARRKTHRFKSAVQLTTTVSVAERLPRPPA